MLHELRDYKVYIYIYMFDLVKIYLFSSYFLFLGYHQDNLLFY